MLAKPQEKRKRWSKGSSPIGGEGEVPIGRVRRAVANDGDVGGDIKELQRDRALDGDLKGGAGENRSTASKRDMRERGESVEL